MQRLEANEEKKEESRENDVEGSGDEAANVQRAAARLL